MWYHLMVRNVLIICLSIAVLFSLYLIKVQQIALVKVVWSNNTLVLDYTAERNLKIECEKKLKLAPM